MAHKLDAEDSFPDITLNLVGGSALNLPGDLESNYSIALFYRGHWQPYCRRQLADFEKELESLDALDAKVYAASVDDIEKARESFEKTKLRLANGRGTLISQIANLRKLGAKTKRQIPREYHDALADSDSTSVIESKKDKQIEKDN